MIVDFNNRPNVENFVIDNNIVKGVSQSFDVGNRSLSQVILETISNKPNHVALINVDEGKVSTLAEIKDRSVRCALWLKKQGITSGDVVVNCTHNHNDSCIPILATFYTGAIVNPWHNEIALKPAQHLMKLIQPKIIFSSEIAVEILLEAAKLEHVDVKIIVFGKHEGLQSFEDILQEQTNDEVQSFIPREIENPAKTVGILLLSSGSTGFPKGIMHSYENVLKQTISFSIYPMKDVSMWYSANYWATGFFFVLESLLSYGTRIIHNEFDPEDTCKIIEKYKVQRILISAVMINYLCKSNVLHKYKMPSLELVTTTGSKVNIEMFKMLKSLLPHATVLQTYGMTEFGRCTLLQTKNTTDISSAGFVTPCIEAKIVDVETGNTLKPNGIGELYLRSPIIMLGYYKNSEETKKTIDEEGWLHTGDKAFFTERGEFFIVDRLKDVMKYHNHHVSPSEIEEVLMTHPDIVEVAVVPMPHEIDGERALAYVKKLPGSKVTENELVKLSAILGETKKLWGGVKFLEELPKTPSGKILKIKLKEMAIELAKLSY